jgi:hypothetical protein
MTIDGTLTLNLLSVGRTCVVGVDLLRGGALVEGNEPPKKVIASGIVVVASGVVGEVVSKR